MKRLLLLSLITLSTIGSLSRAAQKSCCDCSCWDGVVSWLSRPVAVERAWAVAVANAGVQAAAPAQAAPAPHVGVPQGLPAQLPIAPAPAMVAFIAQQPAQLVPDAAYQAPQGRLDDEQQRVRRPRAAARADEQPDAVPQDENAMNGLPSQGPMGAGLLDVDAPVAVGLATGALELARLRAIERAQHDAAQRRQDEERKRKQAERKGRPQPLPVYARPMRLYDSYAEDRTRDFDPDRNPITGMGGRYFAAAAADMDDVDGPGAGAGAADDFADIRRQMAGFVSQAHRLPGQDSPAQVHHHHYHGSSIVVNQGGVVNIGKYSPSNSDERREPASVGPAAAASEGAGAGAASGQVRTMVARQAEIDKDRNKALGDIILGSVDAVGGLSIAELAKLTNAEAEEQSRMEEHDPNDGLHARIMAQLAFKKESELRVPSVDAAAVSPLLAVLVQGDKAAQAAAASALPDFEQL